MSLTGHLGDPSSPVYQWFAQRLPHTAPVVSEANRELRRAISTTAAPAGLRSRPDLPSTAADPRFVGTALDLLIRATLERARWVPAAALVGALRLEKRGIAGASDVAGQVCGRLRELAPAQLTTTADEWREVATQCVLLARFEQAGRSLRAVQWSAERLRSVAPSLDAYATSELVDERDVDDTATAAPVIAEDHADLRSAAPLLLGQTFALSGALGGADADVIAGDLLLDFKAATTKRIVRGPALWQVVGYALADTDDTYGLRAVGISALRWRRRWIIDLDELASRLAGESVAISVLRREFADLFT